MVADLAAMGIVAGADPLAQGAVVIAQAMDKFTPTAESAATLSAIVKAHGELRATLAALRKEREAGDDGGVDDGAGLSAPVRDPA